MILAKQTVVQAVSLSMKRIHAVKQMAIATLAAVKDFGAIRATCRAVTVAVETFVI